MSDLADRIKAGERRALARRFRLPARAKIIVQGWALLDELAQANKLCALGSQARRGLANRPSLKALA